LIEFDLIECVLFVNGALGLNNELLENLKSDSLVLRLKKLLLVSSLLRPPAIELSRDAFKSAIVLLPFVWERFIDAPRVVYAL
jgi:hypothetical protein